MNGFIQQSRSLAGAPIFFAKKKDGSLHFVVDYRGLNKIIVLYWYALPLIMILLEHLSGAKYFTKVDLRGAYNFVRICPGDEWKNTFCTLYGHFKHIIMLFGLTTETYVLQHMVNDIFHDLSDIFSVVYLDNILMYSKSNKEHGVHVCQVLERWQEYGLYDELKKCTFGKCQLKFWGM